MANAGAWLLWRFLCNSIDIMPNAGAWMMLGVCPKVAHVPSGLTEVIILGHEAVGDNRERSKIYLGKRCANRSSWFIGVPNACAKCSQLFREQRCAQQPQMLGKCTTRMQYLTTLSRSSGKC